MTARPKMRSARAKAPFGSRTDVGCVRDHNEDSLIATPPLFVEDLGSTNGTTVNGERVSEPVSLRNKDVVTIGDVSIRVRYE